MSTQDPHAPTHLTLLSLSAHAWCMPVFLQLTISTGDGPKQHQPLDVPRGHARNDEIGTSTPMFRPHTLYRDDPAMSIVISGVCLV